MSVFQHFGHCTNAMETDCYPTLSQAVPWLESLMAFLEDVVNPAGLEKKPYGYPCIPSDVIKDAANVAWTKLQKYYERTDSTYAYACATGNKIQNCMYLNFIHLL